MTRQLLTHSGSHLVSNPLEIILTCNYSPWSRYSGGAQKSVHMVATEMARQGLKTTVVYSKAPWENITVPEDLPYPICWTWFFAIRPGISSPLRFLNGLAFFLTVRKLSTLNSVIHGNGDEASLFGFIRSKRAFVFTNRYPEFPAFLSGANWAQIFTWTRIFFHEPRFVAIAMAMKNADHVTVTSRYSLEEVARCFGIDTKITSVVPNGVDANFLDIPLEDACKSGVIFYGRLTRAKGSDLVLEAYARLDSELRKRHPLSIAGDGPLRKQLEDRAMELGLTEVLFIGWKAGKELANEILSRKVVCLPSREESFGNTVVEALALGQTLVSSSAGSIPEVVGPWGNLVGGESPQDLADQMEIELNRERSFSDRQAQRNYIRAQYSWSGTSKRFLELYASIF